MLKEICNAAGKLARFPAPFVSDLPGLFVACDGAHETDPFINMVSAPVEVNEDELPDRSAAHQGCHSPPRAAVLMMPNLAALALRSGNSSSFTSTGAGCHTWCKRIGFVCVVAGDK